MSENQKNKTKLEVILEDLGISQRDLYRKIIDRLEDGETPIGVCSISQIVTGRQKKSQYGTLLKIVNAINEIREIRLKYPNPISLEEIANQ